MNGIGLVLAEIHPARFAQLIEDGDGRTTDPAADIAAYLLESKDWAPENVPDRQLSPAEQTALRELALSHLKDAYPKHVSAMNANQHSSDFQRVQVTYAYRKWVSQEAAYFQAFKNAQAAKVANLGGDVVKSVSDSINSRATALTGIAQKFGLSASISPIIL